MYKCACRGNIADMLLDLFFLGPNLLEKCKLFKANT